MKKLITRTITGVVLVLVMLGAILASEYTFVLLFLLILIGGINEFYKLFGESEVKPNRILGYLISVTAFTGAFLIARGDLKPVVFLGVFPLLLVVMAAEMYRKSLRPLENIAVTIFSFIYLGVPLALIHFLVYPALSQPVSYSPKLLISLFALIWTYDSGAYLFGVSIGKHRLFERISPKKSWEGAIGGTLTALAAAWIISTFIPEIKLFHWLVLSFLIVVSSTFGDLTESMFKRYFGIKDSGHILPGHGGVLDRFDSLFFATPVVVTYLKLFIE